MLKLTNRAAITAALTDQSLDPELRALIGLRAWQLDDVRSQPLGRPDKFVVVQSGDTPSEIHAAVGFPITWGQADQPSFEWMHDHGRCLSFEILGATRPGSFRQPQAM